jgi:uncharacterized protein (TIGR03435 family)
VFGVSLVSATLFSDKLVYGQEVPSFEVTSVKLRPAVPHQEDSETLACYPNGRFLFQGQRLQSLIQWAFDLKPLQLVGLPSWLQARDALYVIEGQTDARRDDHDCRLMVQALITTRFKLKSHMELREVPAYALVLAKNGPKMNRATPPERGLDISVNSTSLRIDPALRSGVNMSQLAGLLAERVDRPVLDRTGLEGAYKVFLRFHAADAPGSARGLLEGVDVFLAVEKQLGLKLEPRKELFNVLVIDHIERADPN